MPNWIPDALNRHINSIIEFNRGILFEHDIKGAQLDYVCIFTRDQGEYDYLAPMVANLGEVVDDSSPSGPVIKLKSALHFGEQTLSFIKVRQPDPTCTQEFLGECDWRVPDWEALAANFPDTLDDRGAFKTICLSDKDIPEARAAFSSPSLSEDFGAQ